MNRKTKLTPLDQENYQWFARRWSVLSPVIYTPTSKAAWDMLHAFADAVFSAGGYSTDPFVAWRQEAVHHCLFICRRLAMVNPRLGVYDMTDAIVGEIMRRQPDAWNDATMQGYFEGFGVLASHIPESEQKLYLGDMERHWNAAEDARVLAGGVLGERTFERQVRMTYAEFVARHLTGRHYAVNNEITEALRLEIMICAEGDMVPTTNPGLSDIARQDTWTRIGEWFARNPNGSPQGFLFFLENEERVRVSRPVYVRHAIEAVDMVSSIAKRYV